MSSRNRKWLGLLALAIAGALTALAARAGPTLIGPLSLEINQRTRVAVVKVNNLGTEPMVLQTAVQTWSQTHDADEKTPTDEVLVSPAIATIPAGRQQLFRVALRQPLAPGSERAYRVLLTDESELNATSGADTTTNLQIRVTHSLPLFVRTLKGSKAVLALEPCAATPESVCVKVRNTGSMHAVVRRIQFSGGDWATELKPNAVLLAGTTRDFVAPGTTARNIPIAIKVDADDVAVTGTTVTSP